MSYTMLTGVMASLADHSVPSRARAQSLASMSANPMREQPGDSVTSEPLTKMPASSPASPWASSPPPPSKSIREVDEVAMGVAEGEARALGTRWGLACSDGTTLQGSRERLEALRQLIFDLQLATTCDLLEPTSATTVSSTAYACRQRVLCVHESRGA